MRQAGEGYLGGQPAYLAYESLDPYLDDELKERRDQAVLSAEGIDYALAHIIETKETAILQEDPEVAEAFAYEVLVNKPACNGSALNETDFESLVDFEDTQERTRAEKIVQFAQILYQLHASTTPENIKTLLNTEEHWVGCGTKTPHRIIASGSREDNTRLYDWTLNLRYTLALNSRS